YVFSSSRRHTRFSRDWSSDVCSSDLVDAADWARALPAGLDTEVGSGGVALSSAQAQQIALARLVLADPHTLVLDEATSLLDPREVGRASCRESVWIEASAEAMQEVQG